MSKTILGILVIVLLGGGYYFYNTSFSLAPETPIVQEQTNNVVATPPVEENNDTAIRIPNEVVMYTDKGFSPSTITIKQGTKVTFVNNTTNKMWVASDEHPTHTEYDGKTKTEHCPDTLGTAFDQCASGSTYTFTFNKVGSFDYHNHSVASDGGKVIVTQ